MISQDIVKYLHEVEGFSLEEIADISSLSIDDVHLIMNGSKTFNSSNITSIIEKQDKTIISILAAACPESHLPEKLQKHVSFYKHVQEVKKKKQNKR